MDSDQRRIGDNVIQYKESLKVNNNITSGSKENSAIDIQNSKNSEDYDFEDYSHETMASEIRNDQNTDIDSYNTSSKKEDRQFNNKTYYLNTENNIFHQSIKDNDKSEQRLKMPSVPNEDINDKDNKLDFSWFHNYIWHLIYLDDLENLDKFLISASGVDNEPFSENDMKNKFILLIKETENDCETISIINNSDNLNEIQNTIDTDNNIFRIIRELSIFNNTITNIDKNNSFTIPNWNIYDKDPNTEPKSLIDTIKSNLYSYLNSKFRCWVDSLKMIISK